MYKINLMYSVTGQTEDQQVSHQHCPPRVMIFEIDQPIINVKIISRVLPNNYVRNTMVPSYINLICM